MTANVFPILTVDGCLKEPRGKQIIIEVWCVVFSNCQFWRKLVETKLTIKRIYLEGWFDSVNSVRDIEVFQEPLKLPKLEST